VINMTGMLPARINWELTLTRKATTNDAQNARKRIEYVRAPDQATAKQIALAMPQNAAFRVSSIKERR